MYALPYTCKLYVLYYFIRVLVVIGFLGSHFRPEENGFDGTWINKLHLAL